MDDLRIITWIGSSKEDLKSFPENVQKEIGFTLHRLQEGHTPQNIKSLKGLGSGTFEIITNYNNNTYRTVYAIKLGIDIYILHAFQKKSKIGIKTPHQEIELIRHRLMSAREDAKKAATRK